MHHKLGFPFGPASINGQFPVLQLERVYSIGLSKGPLVWTFWSPTGADTRTNEGTKLSSKWFYPECLELEGNICSPTDRSLLPRCFVYITPSWYCPALWTDNDLLTMGSGQHNGPLTSRGWARLQWSAIEWLEGWPHVFSWCPSIDTWRRQGQRRAWKYWACTNLWLSQFESSLGPTAYEVNHTWHLT